MQEESMHRYLVIQTVIHVITCYPQVIESKPVGFIAQAGDQLKVEDIYRAASLKAFRDMKTDASKSDF